MASVEWFQSCAICLFETMFRNDISNVVEVIYIYLTCINWINVWRGSVFLGCCLQSFIFTIHEDIKFSLPNKSWNVMVWPCIDLEFSRLLGPARTMAGSGGQCVGHDVDGFNTTTSERMNQFRSCTGMIKAWLSLCFFSCQAAYCLATCWIWHLPASTTYLVYDTRFLPLRWRHLVYSRLYSCASCAGGFVLWHRRTGYLEWTHGTDSCLQNVVFFVLAARKGRGSRECCDVDRSRWWIWWTSLIMGRLRVRKVCQWLQWWRFELKQMYFLTGTDKVSLELGYVMFCILLISLTFGRAKEL